MSKISIVGLGPGEYSLISQGALDALHSSCRIYLRTEKHPIVNKLKETIKYTSLDYFYDSEENFEDVYYKISKHIVELAKEGDLVYAVPGHPRVAEKTVGIIESMAKENNIEVDVLPGASAFVIALVGSGLNTHKFAFEGFLDRDKKVRRNQLEELKEERRTIIFYESPHRLKDTLKDMLKVLGNRRIAVNREITKKYQEIIREDIETVINIFNEKEVKGEFVLIVEGFKGEKTVQNSYEDLTEREYVITLMENGMDKKDAIKTVCKDRKLKKDVVYKQVLDL